MTRFKAIYLLEHFDTAWLFYTLRWDANQFGLDKPASLGLDLVAEEDGHPDVHVLEKGEQSATHSLELPRGHTAEHLKHT